MDHRTYLTCLWPGLSELWWRGRLSALPLAIGFAIGLNSLLVLRFLLPTWLNPVLVRVAWWIGLAVWIYWTVKSVRELPSLLDPRSAEDQPDRFSEAHAAYLRGQWEQAESLLIGMLSIEPRDPPALLLLSGVYRHTARLEHAVSLLQEIRRLEVADPWQIEIDAEASRLQRQLERDELERGGEERSTESSQGHRDEDSEARDEPNAVGSRPDGLDGAADLAAA